MPEPQRLTEPLLKAHLALRLLADGAKMLRISVDGAEPAPTDTASLLAERGFPLTWASGPTWTGECEDRDGRRVVVISQPGADIEATFADGSFGIAECKGEPTAAGVRAGTDRTGLYTGLGQLLVCAGTYVSIPERLILGVAWTSRLETLATSVANNKLIRDAGVELALVRYDGEVRFIRDG